jgi:hypothetical protein
LGFCGELLSMLISIFNHPQFCTKTGEILTLNDSSLYFNKGYPFFPSVPSSLYQDRKECPLNESGFSPLIAVLFSGGTNQCWAGIGF